MCLPGDERGLCRPGGRVGRWSLGSYLQLVDWTSRVGRNGNARVVARAVHDLQMPGHGRKQTHQVVGETFSRSRMDGTSKGIERRLPGVVGRAVQANNSR
jgi:hypothetical protein